MKTTTLLSASLLAVLCTEAAAQRLIAIDSSRAIVTIDPMTGARTPQGTLSANAGTPGGLAFDAATRTIYLSSTTNDALYTLNLVSGVATLVGAFGGPTQMHGLEWDSSTGTLFGVSQQDNGLYEIDTTTGAATLVGASALVSFTNLCYDSVHDVLYAANGTTDSLYTVDRATGATTLIGPLAGPQSPGGLAFDCDTRTTFMVDRLTDNLYTLDLATGASTLIGSTGDGNLLALMFMGREASFTTFGSGCAGSVGTPALTALSSPVVGQVFTTQITNIPPGNAAIGVIGFSNTLLGGVPLLPLELGIVGMPGCFMRVDVAVSVPLVPVAGVAPFAVPLPSSASGLTFFEQGYVLDPAANALGLTVTNGGEVVVGQPPSS